MLTLNILTFNITFNKFSGSYVVRSRWPFKFCSRHFFYLWMKSIRQKGPWIIFISIYEIQFILGWPVKFYFYSFNGFDKKSYQKLEKFKPNPCWITHNRKWSSVLSSNSQEKCPVVINFWHECNFSVLYVDLFLQISIICVKWGGQVDIHGR